MITVEPVRTRTELSEFIALPRRLYEGMAGFVAPLDHDRRQLLDPKKGAFFSHGVAKYWIARRNGKAVGRISAQIDFAAVGRDAHKIGMFGGLDAIDDGEIVAALLRSAEGWLHERKRHTVRGPFQLSINSESGLLVEGQLQPAVTLLPWHPSYLGQLVERSGYRTATNLLCYTLSKDFAFDSQLAALGRARSRAEITVRPLRIDSLEPEMDLGRRIFNDGWQQNWGFTPATESDIANLIENFKPFIFPDSGFFIEVRGEPAAFVLTIPNIFEITADLGPNPGAIGWSRLLFRIWRQRYSCFRLTLLGITAKYQNSILGSVISTVAFEEVRQRMRTRGAEELVAGWILEQNQAVKRPLESLGFRHTTTYKVYEKALEIGLRAHRNVDVAEAIETSQS